MHTEVEIEMSDYSKDHFDTYREISDSLLGGVQVGHSDSSDVYGLHGLVGKPQGFHDLVLIFDKKSLDHFNQW